MDQLIDPQLANAQTVKGGPPPTYGGAQGAASRLEQEIKKGRYDINDAEELGEGGMGMVRAIKDRALRRKVAMKVLKGKQHTNYLQSRLILEACITGILEHPGIVPVHDLGTLPVENSEHADVFFTMKKVDGHDLEKIIRLLGTPAARLEPEERGLASEIRDRFGSIPARLGLFLKVCDALAFAHGGVEGLQIIHRDLKPANIMVGAYGEVLVMDWGLAKPLGSSDLAEELRQRRADLLAIEGSNHDTDLGATQDGAFVGTWHYAPPEQIEGRIDDIEPRTDVYALGGLLYSLLTLDLPLSIPEKTPPVEVKALVLGLIEKGKTVPLARMSPREGKPAVPEALRPVILKALEPRIAERMDTVVELQKAVSDYLAGFANAFENASLWRHAIYFVKRHKAACITTVAGLLVISVLTFGFVREVAFQRDKALSNAELASKNENIANANAKTAWDNVEKALLRAWGASSQLSETIRPWERMAKLAEALRYDQSMPRERRNRELAEDAANQLARIRIPSLSLSKTVLHHEGPVTCAEFSEDGVQILTASEDGTAKVWDRKTVSEKVMRHPSKVIFASFDRTGHYIATMCLDGSARVWNVRGEPTQEALIPMPGIDWIKFDSTGSHLIGANKEEVVVADIASQGIARRWPNDLNRTWTFSTSNWDRRTQKDGDTMLRVVSVKSGEKTGLAISPRPPVRDTTLAFCSPYADFAVVLNWSGQLELWDYERGRRVCDPIDVVNPSNDGLLDSIGTGTTGLDRMSSVPMPYSLSSVEFSPDGLRFAAAFKNAVVLCNTRDGLNTSRPLEHGAPVTFIRFSGDGRLLVTVSLDQNIRLWDAGNGQPLTASTKFEHDITSVSISSDSRQILTTSTGQDAFIWNVETETAPDTLIRHSFKLRAAVFSPAGKRVASLDEREVRCLDAETGDLLFKMQNEREGRSYNAPEPLTGVKFDASEEHLAVWGGEKARLLRLPDGLQSQEFVLKGGITGLVFAKDGNAVLACGRRGDLVGWNTQTGERWAERRLNNTDLVHMAADVQGRRVVVGDKRGIFHVVSVDQFDAQPVRLDHSATVQKRALDLLHGRFSPDGRYVVTIAGGKDALLWDAQDGSRIGISISHGALITATDIDCSSRLLATAGIDGKVRLWSVEQGSKEVLVLPHESVVVAVAFNPDGSRVVTGTRDGRVQVWSVGTGRRLGLPVVHRDAVVAACFSGDGRRIASASWDYSLRIGDWLQPNDSKALAEAMECVGQAAINDDGKLFPSRFSGLCRAMNELPKDPSLCGDTQSLLGWKFACPFERPVSPFSKRSVQDHLLTEIDWVADDQRRDEIEGLIDSQYSTTPERAPMLGRPSRSVLQSAGRLDPGNALVQLASSVQPKYVGNVDHCREWALKLLPPDAASWVKAGEILIAGRDFHRAKRCAERALQLDKANSQARSLLNQAQGANQ